MSARETERERESQRERERRERERKREREKEREDEARGTCERACTSPLSFFLFFFPVSVCLSLCVCLSRRLYLFLCLLLPSSSDLHGVVWFQVRPGVLRPAVDMHPHFSPRLMQGSVSVSGQAGCSYNKEDTDKKLAVCLSFALPLRPTCRSGFVCGLGVF